jgi:hypothetical protein
MILHLESECAKVMLLNYTYNVHRNQFIVDIVRQENVVSSTSKRHQGAQATVKAYMIVKDEDACK